MSNNFVEIAPNSSIHDGVTPRHDIVGFFPYSFNAVIENTGDRVQDFVNRTGMPVVVGELSGQDGQPIDGRNPVAAMQPGSAFRDTCRWQADNVRSALDRYDGSKRIGIGHSLGGVIITGMAVYAKSNLFDAIELADGFNLRKPGKPTVGGFLRYQALDVAQQLLHRAIGQDTTGGCDLSENDWGSQAQKDKLTYFEKVNLLAPVMRSKEGYIGATVLAGEAGLPLHVIGYRHGLSGSSKQLERFRDELEDIRSRAVARQPKDVKSERLITTIEDKWHSALLNSEGVAANLLKTIDLTTMEASL